MSLPVTSIVLDLAHHAQQQMREWMDMNALKDIDPMTVRRIMERQNAVMALLISELELEQKSRSYD